VGNVGGLRLEVGGGLGKVKVEVEGKGSRLKAEG
jgi:hypothetical protein